VLRVHTDSEIERLSQSVAVPVCNLSSAVLKDRRSDCVIRGKVSGEKRGYPAHCLTIRSNRYKGRYRDRQLDRHHTAATIAADSSPIACCRHKSQKKGICTSHTGRWERDVFGTILFLAELKIVVISGIEWCTCTGS